MRFFEKMRPEIYIHSPKLRRDKQTMRRMWGFTLIVAMKVEHAEACDVRIAKAWQYITERDSAAIDVSLAGTAEGCTIDFFAQIDDATPALHLEQVDLSGLRLTWKEGGGVEFWFAGEHENVGGIHDFMKAYAFTRCWAQFQPRQGDLPIEPSPLNKQAVIGALDDLVEPIREGVVTTMTLQIPGEQPVVIDREGAERIHKASRKKKR